MSFSIQKKSSTKSSFTINGKEYDSYDVIPEAERKLFDADGNGTIDALENLEKSGVLKRHGFSSFKSVGASVGTNDVDDTLPEPSRPLSPATMALIAIAIVVVVASAIWLSSFFSNLIHRLHRPELGVSASSLTNKLIVRDLPYNFPIIWDIDIVPITLGLT